MGLILYNSTLQRVTTAVHYTILPIQDVRDQKSICWIFGWGRIQEFSKDGGGTAIGKISGGSFGKLTKCYIWPKIEMGHDPRPPPLYVIMSMVRALWNACG